MTTTPDNLLPWYWPFSEATRNAIEEFDRQLRATGQIEWPEGKLAEIIAKYEPVIKRETPDDR